MFNLTLNPLPSPEYLEVTEDDSAVTANWTERGRLLALMCIAKRKNEAWSPEVVDKVGRLCGHSAASVKAPVSPLCLIPDEYHEYSLLSLGVTLLRL